MSERGILVMAYGTPSGLDDVERYYLDIRRGKPPPPEMLQELTDRYRAIGGRSPLLEITQAQVAGIEERVGARCYLGQKHSPPFIKDAIADMAASGVGEATGLVLAPHYSSMSVGDYRRRAETAARELDAELELHMVDSWHLAPGYITFLIDGVNEAIEELPEEVRDEALVVFSAHSLPTRILEQGDPYPEQLKETAEAVATQMSLPHWRTGWQSAGRTADPWLGPDILEIVSAEAAAGRRAIVVCACGFVADHLEVLYDLDIEAKQLAESKGMHLTRTRAPNAEPPFLDTLAAVVIAALDRHR